ncbi:glycosyltransferase [Candidatus Pacearchaeota archaeon]|nr:glycosyltransferase [Candidatus Pacearchaeota archaeon]
MGQKPRISFILGILNAERTLAECLDSILQQKTKIPYEIIVVDGGSTDTTLSIIRKYQKKVPSIRLYHNPARLSEGKGMSKDMGVQKAKGEIVIFIDHDNILLESTWLTSLLAPFTDQTIMASQSLLASHKEDSLFLTYVNEIGVEDPFAIPYSLVAQVQLNPSRFRRENAWYTYVVSAYFPLFGGANGCAFRKEVFDRIGGYTRDVDIFASMGEQAMRVAIVPQAHVHHKTSASFLSYLYKKGVYFNRFISQDYTHKKFNWIPDSLRGKVWFASYVFLNLTFLWPISWSFFRFIRNPRLFWLLHPGYLFIITLEYCFLSLLKFPNLLRYSLFSRRK